MAVTIKVKKDTVYAFLKGEIDHHTAPELRNTIDDALALNETAKTVLLDFKDVSFMDSSGVGLVMGRYRYCVTLGKTLEVVNLSERNYKIMEMSGIPKIAQISKIKM